MGKGVYLVLVLLGVCSTSYATSLQYQYITELKTWAEAQEYCREVHMDLAMVENKRNMSSLLRAIEPQYKGKVWIGLQRRVEYRWVWTLWNSSEPVSYTSWGDTEPNNIGGNICGFKFQDYWTDGDCSIQCSFLCFDERSGKYIAVHIMKSWYEAQQYCRESYTDLATIPNATVEREIEEVADNETWYWIGLFEDDWDWSDKSQVSSFRSWRSGKPDNYGGAEDCVAMDMENGGLWDDLSCELNLPFVCLGEEKKKIVQVTLSSGGDVPLDDLSQTILEQIKGKLIESGLPPDIRLQWRTQDEGRIFKPKK